MITGGFFVSFLLENKHCDPSSELPPWSGVRSQHIFICSYNRNYPLSPNMPLYTPTILAPTRIHMIKSKQHSPVHFLNSSKTQKDE